jgi:hypothetical protein
MWHANLDRLGFILGDEWTVRERSLVMKATVEGDGMKVRESFVYRPKDGSWAIEQALRRWRTEMRALLGLDEDTPAFERIQVSVRGGDAQ